MFYLLQTMWGWLLAGSIVGLIWGWLSWSREPRAGSFEGWARVVFIAALVIAELRLFPGRYGYWLETALLFSACYVAGCFLGGWLRSSLGMEAPVRAGLAQPPAGLAAAPAPAIALVSPSVEIFGQDTSGAYPGVRPAWLAGADGKADDLKLMCAMGPLQEKFLNDIGVHHFAQIGGWSADNARWYDYHIGQPGFTAREKWIEQASSLAKGRDTDFSAAVKAGSVAPGLGLAAFNPPATAAGGVASAARAEAEREAAIRISAAKAEADRAQAALLAAAKAEVERAEALRALHAKSEAGPAELARADAARAEADRERAIRASASQAEMDRTQAALLANAKAEAERTEAARILHMTNEAERVEAARLASMSTQTERVEAMRLADAKAETARQAAMKAEADQKDFAGRAEMARVAAAKAEAERQAAMKSAAERKALAGAGAQATPGHSGNEPPRAAQTLAQHPGAKPGAEALAAGMQGDDLKRIKGIGPKNAKVCNDLGVHRFRQIADWTPENATWMGHHMAFPGRIEREHWIAQAQLLDAGYETEHSLAVKSGKVNLDALDDPLTEADAAALHADLPEFAAPVEGEAAHKGKRPLGLASPRGGKADDLKRIKGIGKQNEARLHGLGVWHFSQIAGWTRENVEWAGSFLSFPGRIDREDWIKQSLALAAGEDTAFSKRVAAGLVPTSADDAKPARGKVAETAPKR